MAEAKQHVSAIFKKSFVFVDWASKQMLADRSVPAPKRKHRILLGHDPQTVPAWCAETDLWKLAEADGSIIEVAVKSKPAPVPKTEEPAAEESEAGAGEESEDAPASPKKKGGKKNGGA